MRGVERFKSLRGCDGRMNISSIRLRLGLALGSARSSERRVRSLSKRFGAGLTPLEHLLDDLVEFLDWFEGHYRSAKLQGFVMLLREAERYDAFRAIVDEVESRRNRLSRLSTTFTPIQRGRYRSLLFSLVSFHRRLMRVDSMLGWLVRHPQDVSKALERSFRFSMRVRVRSKRVRVLFDPSGTIMFGDGIDAFIPSIFEMGPRKFKRRVRSFLADAFSSALPGGSIDRAPAPLSIVISSVSAAHSSLHSKRGTVLSINAVEFVHALFGQDSAAILEHLESTSEKEVVASSSENRVLTSIRSHAAASLLDVWKKRELTGEYAGVLSVEQLELPSHTGSFSDAASFVSYAEHRVPEDFGSYLARDIGLHMAWILFCDRMGHYRPISTAAIRELAGRKNVRGVLERIVSEIRSSDEDGFVKKYARSCLRLTRAPLIKHPEVF